MEAFAARHSRWRLGLLFALSLSFVALGLLFAIETRDAAGLVFGGIATAFFGLCAVVIGFRVFDRRVQVRIDCEGIFCRSWSDHAIGWEDIAEVSTWNHRGQRFIILSLKDRARHPPRRGLAAWTAGANRRLTGGDVPLGLTGSDRGFAQALGAIQHFRREP